LNGSVDLDACLSTMDVSIGHLFCSRRKVVCRLFLLWHGCQVLTFSRRPCDKLTTIVSLAAAVFYSVTYRICWFKFKFEFKSFL
jgi:hypothetical protein